MSKSLPEHKLRLVFARAKRGEGENMILCIIDAVAFFCMLAGMIGYCSNDSINSEKLEAASGILVSIGAIVTIFAAAATMMTI
jgi:hypothetical protein